MLKRVYTHLDEHVETYIATVAIAIFATLTVVQVIMRYAFNSPLTWGDEIARYALVWFVYVAASYAVRYQRHVKFNLLVYAIGRKSPLAERLVRLLGFVIWITFLIAMLVLSALLVLNQFRTGQVSPATKTPMYLVYIALPLGFLLMSFRVVQHIVGAVTDLIKNPRKPLPHTTVIDEVG